MSNDMKLERSELDMKMLAAWLNVSVDQIPPENRAHHNPVTMEAWRRVGEAAIRHASETSRHQPQEREAVLEQAAQRIYEHYKFGVWTPGEKPAWVPNGNSRMQDLARSFARAAIRNGDRT